MDDKIKALVAFQARMRSLKQGKEDRLAEKEKAARKRMKKRAQDVPAPCTIVRGDPSGEDYKK